MKISLSFVFLYLLYCLPASATINIDSLINVPTFIIDKKTADEEEGPSFRHYRVYKETVINELQTNETGNLKKLAAKGYLTEQYAGKQRIDTITILDNFERSTLLLITGNYQLLLTAIKKEDYAFEHFYQGLMGRKPRWNKNHKTKYLSPALEDQFDIALIGHLKSNFSFHQQQVANSTHTEGEKKFLEVYLFALSHYGDYCQKADTVLTTARKYLQSAHEGYLDFYVREHIYVKNKTTLWGIAGTITGTGVNFPLGNLQKYFKPSILIPLNAMVDVSYQKFYLSASWTASFKNKIKHSFTNEINWGKDSSVFFSIADITLGYSLVDNNKFRINPYIGVADMRINNAFGGGVKVTDIHNSNMLTFGIIADKALNYGECDNYSIGESGKYVEYIRLKVGFTNPEFKFNNTKQKGGLLSIQITFIARSILQRKVKHDASILKLANKGKM